MAFEIITLPQGDSFARSIESIYDEHDALAKDLTGWAFVFTLKANQDDADEAALITRTTEQFTLNNELGEASVALTPAQLAVLKLGTAYYFAIKGKTPAGFIGTLDEGILTLAASARQNF